MKNEVHNLLTKHTTGPILYGDNSAATPVEFTGPIIDTYNFKDGLIFFESNGFSSAGSTPALNVDLYHSYIGWAWFGKANIAAAVDTAYSTVVAVSSLGPYIRLKQGIDEGSCNFRCYVYLYANTN